MREALRQRRREEVAEDPEIPVDFLQILEPKAEVAPELTAPETEPVTESATEAEPEVGPPEPARPAVTGRPSRVTRKPIGFGDCE